MEPSLLRTDKELTQSYETHVVMVYRLCFTLLKNRFDTEDAVQTTLTADLSPSSCPWAVIPSVRYRLPDYYAINPTVLIAFLDYEGQTVTFEVEDNSVSTGVAIKKTGYAEVMPNQPIQYTITSIGNTSTVPLSSFYWRDTLPGQVPLSKVGAGAYNQQLSYKIVYKTNLKDSYQTLADSLSTTKNDVLEASPAALSLASNERVTEIIYSGVSRGSSCSYSNLLNGLYASISYHGRNCCKR